MKTMIEQTDIARTAQSRTPESNEYPVRDYIAAMGRELAQMARWDGDEGLAALLEAVEARAQGPRPGADQNRLA